MSDYRAKPFRIEDRTHISHLVSIKLFILVYSPEGPNTRKHPAKCCIGLGISDETTSIQ
ncbi:hypothetical protein I4300191C4_15010 [Solibaculum mannosilyticum]